jgi:RHS repeat-associated protein
MYLLGGIRSLSSFISTNDPNTSTTPKAYLNWMLLDNQFNYVSNLSGAIAVASPDVLQTMAKTLGLHHSGYLYIWVSNETPGWDVFFDNLSVEMFSGPMLEENHYYPFGLTMAGISDKALKSNYAENKYRYNKGSELQNKEFSDGSGLELYETPLRSLDPQVGRWWQIDPKTEDGHEDVSTYNAMNDDPTRYNDPKGEEGEEANACCDLAKAWNTFKQGQRIAGIVEAVGGGPEDPVADVVAGAVEVGTIAKSVWDFFAGSSNIVVPVAGPMPPSAPTGTAPPGQSSANATSNQGSGQGRGSNNRKPDKSATGDHTVSDRKGSTTYEKNDRNPSGFQEVKRTDTKGGAHNDVPTPHTHEGGKVTPAKPEDIPKTDLSKNVPPPPPPPPPTNPPPQNP